MTINIYIFSFWEKKKKKKNVYSVFRYNPPSVGFAQLSDVAVAQSQQDQPVPTPTIGSAAPTVTATGTMNSAQMSCGRRWWTSALLVAVVLVGSLS